MSRKVLGNGDTSLDWQVAGYGWPSRLSKIGGVVLIEPGPLFDVSIGRNCLPDLSLTEAQDSSHVLKDDQTMHRYTTTRALTYFA